MPELRKVESIRKPRRKDGDDRDCRMHGPTLEGRMRINVYSEELTDRIEVTPKQTTNTKAVFYGLHFYLHSAEQLHSGKADDAQSAVILWKDSPEGLLALLTKATAAVHDFVERRR